ncbi:LacI family transcriptional regulator [Pullulanibacillus camelliae]|uniref:LacI family transcriptional regulator n=1 Tax=Pullulanibacillus camelliae TaxID=1707096 RepID=A0A8J2YL07_9BACL|nr:LacI family DNA-binding transcriptional regulator [Pullulanibacillus camelliae]GGE49771.1 LacI family transcriptional regulator [Pullulanibacillus camelliae]
MDDKKKITIKDVAKHACVGLGTVSRAINGASGISPKTRKRVFESIKELGYTPDVIAQSMRSNKYKNIAFFIDISNVAFSKIAKGIQYELDNLGYILSLCDIGDKNVIEKVMTFMNGRKFDGIILSLPREDDQELHQFFSSIKIPIVTLDRDIPDIPAGITTDYFSSVKKATHYLLSLGHKGIALIGGSRHIRPTRVSIDAFQEAYNEKSIPCPEDLILEGQLTSEFGRRAIYDLLPKIRSGQVSAIFTLNNQIFQGVLHVLRENNLEYPKDISLITFEDYELTQLLNPSVTVIRRPLLEMGKSVSRILIKYIEEPDLYGKIAPSVIPTEFIIRDSCKFL